MTFPFGSITVAEESVVPIATITPLGLFHIPNTDADCCRKDFVRVSLPEKPPGSGIVLSSTLMMGNGFRRRVVCHPNHASESRDEASPICNDGRRPRVILNVPSLFESGYRRRWRPTVTGGNLFLANWIRETSDLTEKTVDSCLYLPPKLSLWA